MVCERDFKTAAGLRVHIEYAAVHRDDSDDDDSDDDSIDDSAEGWEDELGSRVFPEENSRSSNAGETEGDSYVNYWTEDDDDELEEERETYYGFARVPAPASDARSSERAAESPPACGDPVSIAATSLSSKGTNEHCAPSSGVFFSCPLCLEAPKENSATRCGHLFCTSCIRTALSMKKMCPVCREFAQPRQLRKIYLSAA